ncbi:hypothetical protein PM082_020979 [Marasmius tenuissimus]|nr:hypothetical protein PM082_020979 [Marasmius tenuissimus]
MSKESLPLRVRADIRDLWDSPNSSLHEAITSLQQTLGYKIPAEAEWPALWSSLQTRFPDKGTFVPTIVQYAVAWYERLLGRLENDVHAAWTEELLNVLAESKRRLLLKVEPCPSGRQGSPFTTWDANLGSFCLGIPNSDPIAPSRLASTLDACFDILFTGKEPSPASSLPAEDDWAEVIDDMAPASRSMLGKSSSNGPSASIPQEERLPSADTLSRPSELFKSTAPHIMTIECKGEGLTVQCSHQPSLELMVAYLTKWARTNPHDSLKFHLLESEFSFGIIDTLQIEPNARRYKSLNPTIILAFVEGVLGYTMVHTTGTTWMYRSSSLLK